MFQHAVLVLIAAGVHAIPWTTLEKRNACDGVDAEPILYHEYGSDSCPPAFQFDPNSPGNCQMTLREFWFARPTCSNFCQVRTNYYYGREQIFLSNPYCHGPMTCTITETNTVAWSRGVTITNSVKLTDAFTAGVSGSITKQTSTAHARSNSVKLEQNQCGYFTFLPIVKETCGSWTEGDLELTKPDEVLGCGNPRSIENVCITQGNVARGTKDDPWGDTIFVHVDCSTHAPLGMEHQDPAYNHPGVPLDRGIYEAYAATFEDPIRRQGSTSEISCAADDNSPTVLDCSQALIPGPNMFSAVIGKNGGQWWAAYYHSCAIQIEYLQDWADDCDVTFAEIAKAAAGIMDTCRNTGIGKVGGSRTLRNDGKCNAVLRIANTDARAAPQGTP